MAGGIPGPDNLYPTLRLAGGENIVTWAAISSAGTERKLLANDTTISQAAFGPVVQDQVRDDDILRCADSVLRCSSFQCACSCRAGALTPAALCCGAGVLRQRAHHLEVAPWGSADLLLL